MKNFFKTIVVFIVSLFKQPVTPTDATDIAITAEEIETAITIVNNVKAAAASPVAVLVTDLIPTTIDDTIRVELVNDLPVVSAGLTYLKDLLQTSDKGTVLNAVLSKVKFSDKPDQDAFYHTLCARVLMIITNGRVNWSQAVLAAEYYLKNVFQSNTIAK